MKSNILKLSASALLAISFGFSSAGVASANEIQNIPDNPNFSVTTADKSFESSAEAVALYELFSYYEKIPDSVLEAGDDALAQWQKDNPVPKPRASFWGCVGSIAWLIGSNVVGVAKIIKIKNI